MAEMAGGDRDFIQSIERGFAVLLAFDEEHPRPTLADIATATGLSRPAVRRILLTLQRLGYVGSEGGRWFLTPHVLTIGQHYAQTHGIVEIAQPHLLRLTELTHESASIAQLDGLHAVYVGRVHVRRIMGINVDIGTRLPLHATSMGRVLIAWAGTSFIDQVIEEAGLPGLTARTVTDPVEFRAVLHRVREQGWAIVDSELEDGFLSAGVPVREPDGTVLAALTYSTSRARRSPEEVERDVIPHLLDVATAIERDLEVFADSRRTLAPGLGDGFF